MIRDPINSAAAARAVSSVLGPGAETRFETLTKLGQGGSADVFLAYDRVLQRPVVQKLARRPGDALLQEARITAILDHPNIPSVLDAGETEGRAWILLGAREGRVFAEVVQTLPLGRRIEVFLGICDAVTYAHSEGILHLDLKPDNTLVGEFGEVLVLDWGLAKEGAGAAKGGTPDWMAPEQQAGEEVDARTDIYALGRLLEFTMRDLEGRRVRAILKVASRASSLDPAHRHERVEALAQDLRAIRDGALASTAGLAERSWFALARHWRALAAVAGAGMLAIVTALVTANDYVERLERARANAEVSAHQAQLALALRGLDAAMVALHTEQGELAEQEIGASIMLLKDLGADLGPTILPLALLRARRPPPLREWTHPGRLRLVDFIVHEGRVFTIDADSVMRIHGPEGVEETTLAPGFRLARGTEGVQLVGLAPDGSLVRVGLRESAGLSDSLGVLRVRGEISIWGPDPGSIERAWLGDEELELGGPWHLRAMNETGQLVVHAPQRTSSTLPTHLLRLDPYDLDTRWSVPAGLPAALSDNGRTLCRVDDALDCWTDGEPVLNAPAPLDPEWILIPEEGVVWVGTQEGRVLRKSLDGATYPWIFLPGGTPRLHGGLALSVSLDARGWMLRELPRPTAPLHQLRDLALSPGGELLAVAGASLWILDARDLALIETIELGSPVAAVAYGSDGRLAAIAGGVAWEIGARAHALFRDPGLRDLAWNEDELEGLTTDGRILRTGGERPSGHVEAWSMIWSEGERWVSGRDDGPIARSDHDVAPIEGPAYGVHASSGWIAIGAHRGAWIRDPAGHWVHHGDPSDTVLSVAIDPEHERVLLGTLGGDLCWSDLQGVQVACVPMGDAVASIVIQDEIVWVGMGDRIERLDLARTDAR